VTYSIVRTRCGFKSALQIFSIPALILTLQVSAMAGSWPESRGHAQMIYSVSWFQSTSGYGSNGQVSRYGSNGLFNQNQVMPYIEMGITEHTSLSINPSLSNLLYKDKSNRQSGGGFGDVEVSVRHEFARSESGWSLRGKAL